MLGYGRRNLQYAYSSQKIYQLSVHFTSAFKEQNYSILNMNKYSCSLVLKQSGKGDRRLKEQCCDTLF